MNDGPYVSGGGTSDNISDASRVPVFTGVQTIVDKVLRGKTVPERIPLELVRATRDNLGAWVRQLRAWDDVDAPDEYLQRR